MPTNMNDLISELRGDLDERGVATGTWIDNDLLTWLNGGITKVMMALRSVRDGWLTRRMLSTDAAQTILNISYNPQSLRMIANTSIYEMPPDLLEIRELIPLNQSDKDSGVQFISRTISGLEFRIATLISASQVRKTFYYDLIGLNASGLQQLIVVPQPASTIEVELLYDRVNDFYGFTQNIVIIPEWTFTAVKSYAEWRALKSIRHPDTNTVFQSYLLDVRDVASFAAPRQSTDPNYVEGFMEDEDIPPPLETTD